MSVFVLEILGSLIRAGAAMLSGYLITHHYLTAADGDKFTSELVTHVMLALPIVGALAWSIWQKYGQHSKLGAAIDTIAAIKSAAQKTAILLVIGLAFTLPACASNKLVNAANAEHAAVVSVHAVVQAEAQAFAAGAYDNAHHQTYVAALLKVTQSEKALNDALMTWNAASGQPMPQVVSIAVQSIQQILRDVTPLIPANSAVASLATSATAAIAALTGGK